jgi:hypothetical protein
MVSNEIFVGRGERALFAESRRLSSSGDLLRPTLFSTFRLHVDIFSRVERRRRRMMLRLAFVEYVPLSVGCAPDDKARST